MNSIPQWSRGHSHEPALSTADQVQRLVDESKRIGDSILLCATLLTAESGLSLPDMVTLRWCDIDFAGRSIAVSLSKAPDIRLVPMSVRLHAELSVWRRRAPSETAHIFFPVAARNDAAERIAHLFSRTCERLRLPYSLVALRNAVPEARQACTLAAK
jgi:integrase